MRNIFAPIFLLSLFLLYTCHLLDPNAAVVQLVMLLAFLSALACRFLGKYSRSYVFIAFSIGLLITSQFLKEKEEFYRVSQSASAFHIPAEEYATLYGELKSFPEIGNEESILTLETHFLEIGQQKIPVHFFTRLNVRGDGDLRQLYWGDHISVSARVFGNRFNRNFYPNSMEDYALSKKIHFNGACKSVHMVTVEQESTWAWKLIGKWRNKIRDVIEKKYTGKNGALDPKGVFLEATLLGEQGKLGAEQKEQLLSAGVYHIFAISGANIAVIALFSLMFLQFLRVSYRKRYIITGLLLVLFLLLSGMTVSAERAVWMALLIFLARILYLEIDIFNIISFAGLLILMKNPGQFLDAGFILTFTLTAAIVMGRRIFLPLLGKWRVLRLNTHTYINELLSANLSAAIISLPLSLFFFKQYSFVGFFAGLLLLPLTGVITAGGVLLIALPLISARVSALLLMLLDIPLRVFYYIAALFSRAADVFLIYRASPPVLLVVSVLIAFYLLSLSVGRAGPHKFILALFILAGISYMCITIFYYTPKDLEVFYLDVGQGDSQVVVFPGGDALLIDAGGAYYSSDARVGIKTVLPFLLEKRIKIKWAAISHFHPDHARGIAEIVSIIKPEELWISSEPGADLAYEQLSRDLPGSVAVKKLHAPFTKKVGPGGPCGIEILAPDQAIKGGPPRNNHSQVIKISGPYHSFLFTGDIEAEVETRLAETICPKLRADVIKVPHHGSRTSSADSFLKCVGPQWAVFSYAQGNRFNFPHKEALRNYKSRGIKYLSTARSGGIRIVSLPGSLEIETSK